MKDFDDTFRIYVKEDHLLYKMKFHILINYIFHSRTKFRPNLESGMLILDYIENHLKDIVEIFSVYVQNYHLLHKLVIPWLSMF